MATITPDKLRAIPIGTGATGTRVESDSMGEVEVPGEHDWGAQTPALADPLLDWR